MAAQIGHIDFDFHVGGSLTEADHRPAQAIALVHLEKAAVDHPSPGRLGIPMQKPPCRQLLVFEVLSQCFGKLLDQIPGGGFRAFLVVKRIQPLRPTPFEQPADSEGTGVFLHGCRIDGKIRHPDHWRHGGGLER